MPVLLPRLSWIWEPQHTIIMLSMMSACREKDAAALVRTIVSVVAHCHLLGVVHRCVAQPLSDPPCDGLEAHVDSMMLCKHALGMCHWLGVILLVVCDAALLCGGKGCELGSFQGSRLMRFLVTCADSRE